MHLWVPRGKLLGYIITECVIEANPDKILAITEMGLVKNVNDIQQLMGALLDQNHLRNEGFVTARSIGVFLMKRECTNTHTKHIKT
jgi:hypothetical protein